MRKPLLLLILVVVGVLLGATYLVSTLIALLFETGLAHAIIPETLSTRLASISEARRPIPKIIHQTWKNETVPELWAVAQYTCRDIHPDYEYIVCPLLSLSLLSDPVCWVSSLRAVVRDDGLMDSYGPMRRVESLLKRSIPGF